MGNRTIPPGERVELIDERQAQHDWKVKVKNSPIRLDHSRRQVAEIGSPVDPGDRIKLQNLRGMPIWAYNDGEEDAQLDISRAAFDIIFMERTTVASVQADDGSEVAPASGAFVHRSGFGVDPSAGITESLEAPDRADWIVIHVEDADAAFQVEVRYLEEEGSSNYTSRTYDGDGSTEVYERVAVASPFVDVVLSGSATTADYNIYAR